MMNKKRRRLDIFYWIEAKRKANEKILDEEASSKPEYTVLATPASVN
jgi:hypothetical protein